MNAGSSNNRRTAIAIEVKLEVLQAMTTKSMTDVAKEFGIGYSTVKKIKKDEDEILKKAAVCGNLLRKRSRQSAAEEVGDALIAWYYQMKKENTPVNGPIMLDKAKELAATLGVVDFKPSHSWLERLKARNNIRFKTTPSHTAVNSSQTGDWIKNLLERYDPCDIFNATETALFYKAAPAILTGNHPQNTVPSKDRLTLLLLCNSTGTEKKVFTIGKIPNPPCFEKDATPLPYYSSENALMTKWIWCDILTKLDRSLGKRKIVLFVDKTACYKSEVELKNIKIMFVPSAVCPPLDQGIIRYVKIHYRARLLKNMIRVLNSGILVSDFAKTFDVLQALRILQSVWFTVPMTMIVECFQKAGFRNDDVYYVDDSLENSSEVSELKELLQNDFEAFVECDKDVSCFENPVITKTVPSEPAKKQEPVATEAKCKEEGKNTSRVSHKEALKALGIVRRYLDENFSEFDAYYEVEEMVRLNVYASGSDVDDMME